jgi:hypothetical protein
VAAEANVVITQITTGALTVAFINWLKSSSVFPWITAERKTLLRVIAGVLAGVKAIGITYTWNPDAHTLVIGGLTLATILGGTWHWLQSFVTQELIYQTTKSRQPAGTIAVPVVNDVAVIPAAAPAGK